MASTIKKQLLTFDLELHECKETGYKSIYASRDIKPSTILLEFGHGGILTNPTEFTLQIDDNQHIVIKPDYLNYLNHRCNPNVFYDLKRKELICLRSIKYGEELGFFYPSTEWKLKQKFKCCCLDTNCLGEIGGAVYLSKNVLAKYRLSDYIIQKSKKQNLEKAEFKNKY